MRCEEVRDEMIAYVKGELDDERRNEIDEHLARCEGCRRELEMSRKVLAQTQAANEASVVRTVDRLIEDAIEAGASDVHINPLREGAQVQFRIDGVLHQRQIVRREGEDSTAEGMLSREERDAVVARIKQMANIPLAETSVPQDGRIPIRMKGEEERKDYDLRVSIVPTVLGEKITIRILQRGVPILGLENLGFTPEQLEQVRKLLHQPNGIIISTGPVGSGKTTLLYSMIMELINPRISVMTIEDPAEYLIAGAQQVQVNPKQGLTFTAAIRSILRHDPDVIMVGEARDAETVVLSAHAAMTGHLVLSQMLIRDTVSIPQNMAALGVEPWIVGRALVGVIGSVLARRICDNCKEEYTPDAEALEYLGLQDRAGRTQFHRGKGCSECEGTGCRGRVQLHEVLTVGPEISKTISSGETDPDVIAKLATSNGFSPMLEDARRHVLDGFVTAEEAYRILSVR